MTPRQPTPARTAFLPSARRKRRIRQREYRSYPAEGISVVSGRGNIAGERPGKPPVGNGVCRIGHGARWSTAYSIMYKYTRKRAISQAGNTLFLPRFRHQPGHGDKQTADRTIAAKLRGIAASMHKDRKLTGHGRGRHRTGSARPVHPCILQGRKARAGVQIVNADADVAVVGVAGGYAAAVDPPRVTQIDVGHCTQAI